MRSKPDSLRKQELRVKQHWHRLWHAIQVTFGHDPFALASALGGAELLLLVGVRAQLGTATRAEACRSATCRGIQSQSTFFIPGPRSPEVSRGVKDIVVQDAGLARALFQACNGDMRQL